MRPVPILFFSWLLLLCAGFSPFISQAQLTEPIPRFETLGVNEGLSQSSVYAILQDRRGFMWFGTGDGLNRYDGTGIRQFHLPAPRGTVPSTFVRGKLCEDDSGNIWFANEYGLHCWNARREALETRLKHAPGITGFNTFQTVCTDGGALWLFSNLSGVLRYDFIRKTCRLFPLPDSLSKASHIHKMPYPTFCVGPHSIWFKCFEEGPFHFFDTHTLRYERDAEANEGICIFFGKGRHYIISTRGLGIYDSLSRTYSWHNLPAEKNEVTPIDIIEDQWERVWIGTFNDGIYCYENTTGKMRHYVHSNVKLASIPIDLVPSIYIDRANNLWAGTDGGGVSRLDLKPPRFHLFPLNEGDYPILSDYFIKCFFEDAQGNIWFGTHNDGFSILNKKTGQLVNFKQYRNSAGVQKSIRIVGAIQKSADGKIWIAHTLGFSIFDPKSKKVEDIPIAPALPTNSWAGFGWALIQLRDGRMLGGTNNGIVVFQKKNGHWQGRSFPTQPFLKSFVTSLCQMKDGSIWVACKSAGVLQLQAEGDSFRVQKSYLVGLNVRGLHPDEQEDQVLWITSSNGLARLDTRSGQLSFLGATDGMSNTYIYGLLEDQNHNFWMSTNGGLIFYNRTQHHFTTYTYAEGLQSNEFNSGAYLKGKDGTMYFGGIRGFNWFDPNKNEETEISIPGVALRSFQVNGQAYFTNIGSYISLPHNQNNIAFDIAVLDYSRPDANRVAYFLKGWDKQWIESRNHEAHYSNLPPGHYELMIKGRNAAGVWSKAQRIYFVIQAPFWETPFFYLLALLVSIAVLVLLLRHFLRRKLRAQHRIIERQKMLMTERARISKDMHDEIGSGLTRIAMMSETMHQHPEHQELTGKISASARSLSQSMGEIIWALNPTQDTLEGLLAYLREQLILFLEPFHIRYQIQFPDAPPPLLLSNVQRRNLYLTAKEAVGNVLKHAQAESLQVSASLEQGRLLFEVRDDGKGFHEAQVRRSANGLRNMKKRIEEIGGCLEIATDPKGTCLRFGIPLAPRKKKRLTTFFTLHWLRRKNTFEP